MECPNCKKIFKIETRYKIHIEKCEILTYNCILCSKQLSSKSVYTRHLKTCKENINKLQENLQSKETRYKNKINDFEKQLEQERKEFNIQLEQVKKQLEQERKDFNIQLEQERKDFNMQLEQVKKQLEQERKDFKNHLKSKEDELTIRYMKNNELSLINQLKDKKQSSKVYNVVINNYSSGISCKELYEEFLEYYIKNPFIVNANTFHRFLVNSNILLQNIKINDIARCLSSYFDKDENIIIKDSRMEMISKKTVNSIQTDLSNKMIEYTDNSDKDEYEKDKSKIFINKVIVDKNTNSSLFKQVEQKIFSQLKTLLPNNSHLEKLNEIIYTMCIENIFVCIFSSWNDIGYNIGKSLIKKYMIKIDNSSITIDNINYRKVDFEHIIYNIISTVIKDNSLLISHLIKSDKFDKSEYTVLKLYDLQKWIDNKITDNTKTELFSGIEFAIISS